MKDEIQTNLLGRIVQRNPNLEHCWHLLELKGEIVAVWLNEDFEVRIQVKDCNGNSAAHFLNHVFIDLEEEPVLPLSLDERLDDPILNTVLEPVNGKEE